MTDTPPADHGSDRFDYVEIEGPQDQPLPDWLNADYQPCQDCRANLFLRWIAESGMWQSTVAHDDGCPTFKKLADG